MTEKELRARLALGLKMKRTKWVGWLYMENGIIYKHSGTDTSPLTVQRLGGIVDQSKKGEWEIYNEPKNNAGASDTGIQDQT